MSNKNPMCDGNHCRYEHGEVRVYPLGAGGNLILCYYCVEMENAFRYQQGKRYDPKDWPQHNWSDCKVYGGAK
jgi:hypothetical protein